MPSMPVSSLFAIEDPTQYTLYVARWNGEDQPLDIYRTNRSEWPAGNCFPIDRRECDRDYVFSLIDFYHEHDTWLFGGLFRVVARDSTPNESSCRIKAIPVHSGLIGRLKIHMRRPPRGLTFRLEKLLPSMEIADILPVPHGSEEISSP
jgi:hypothetical protein